jgi:cytochrome c peroxidase
MKFRSVLARVVAAVVLSCPTLVACSDDDGRGATNEANATSVAATESAGVPQPASNPTNPAKVELGRLLFWDPVLSGNRDVACASCHSPAHGYSDGRARSIGAGGGVVARNALTVLDAAWNGWTATNPNPDPEQAPMFWDNRARSLEAQARGPILAAAEMRGGAWDETAIFPELVHRLEAIPEYVQRFQAAFGTPVIDERAIVRVLAAFERTLVTVPSYERFLAGDTQALGASAQRGLQVFRNSGCARCHAGPMLSDFELHRFAQGGEAIRTPSLRNVLRTAPYMHDGRAASIPEVLDVYRRVDRRADPAFRDLRVPDGRDLADLLAFFAATSDGAFDETVPTSVPSGLPVGAP